MIKNMKNIELVNTVNGLVAFIQKDKVVPVKVSYAISKNLKELQKKLEPFEEERGKLVERGKDKDIEAEIKELCEIALDVDIHTIPQNVLDNASDLTTMDYMALEFMFEE